MTPGHKAPGIKTPGSGIKTAGFKTASILLAVLGMMLGWAGLPAAQAQAVPVSIDIPFMRAIQTFNTGAAAKDDVYLIIDGVAKGETFHRRYPEGKPGTTAKASPMIRPIYPDKPLNLWNGALADGEFVFVTVTLLHGNKLTAEKEKEYLSKKAEAEKMVAAKLKKKMTASEFKALTKETYNAQREFAKGIKKIFSRELGTDHFGGMFFVAAWNDDGEIKKRLYPVGLTSGEHYGLGVKAYTKIKYTLENVLYKDTDGEWYEFQEAPINDAETIIRIKMLETEMVKLPGVEQPVRNVTDYLFDLTITADGEPLTWELAGEHPGPTIVHDYWDWAE